MRSTRWTLAAGEFRHLHYASVERCPTVQFDSTSNIGKAPIPIPLNVTLTPIHTSLAVKGPLGSTSVGVHSPRPLGWRRIQGSPRGRPERNDRWWEWTETRHEFRTFAQHLRACSIPHRSRSPFPTNILPSCTDKHLLGLFTARMRKWYPPEPYKGKVCVDTCPSSITKLIWNRRACLSGTRQNV